MFTIIVESCEIPIKLMMSELMSWLDCCHPECWIMFIFQWIDTRINRIVRRTKRLNQLEWRWLSNSLLVRETYAITRNSQEIHMTHSYDLMWDDFGLKPHTLFKSYFIILLLCGINGSESQTYISFSFIIFTNRQPFVEYECSTEKRRRTNHKHSENSPSGEIIERKIASIFIKFYWNSLTVF